MKNYRTIDEEYFYFNAVIVAGLLPSIDSIESIANNYLKQDVVPLVITNVKYNEIKSFALDSNLLQFTNGKFYDVPGINQSPYIEKQFFSCALV